MEMSEILRRFRRNAAMILGSRLLSGVLNLATSAIVVRVFGLGDLGMVVLLYAYAQLFSQVLRFESWQALLTYGTGRFEADPPAFRRLLGVTLSLDAATAALGILAGLALLPWAGDLFDWPPAVTGFAPVFLLVVPFITQGTPNGVLRLVDRVDVLAWQHAMNAGLRLGGVLLAWAAEAGVGGLVAAWFAGTVLAGLWQWGAALHQLARRGLLPRLPPGPRAVGREFPGLWRFVGLTNVLSALDLVQKSGTVMAVGALLGAPAAATLQIAQQFAMAVAKPVGQLGPIIAPEFARLAAANDWVTFRRLIGRQIRIMALVMGGLGAVIFAGLGPLLSAVYGPVVLDDIWLFRLLLAATLIMTVFFSFGPAMLSAAKPGTLVAVRILSVGVYVGVALACLEAWGLLAVGIGVLVSRAVSLTLIVLIGRRLLRRRIRRSRATRP